MIKPPFIVILYQFRKGEGEKINISYIRISGSRAGCFKLRSHFSARFRACKAAFSAKLAVVMLVLAAFIAASFANLCAKLANIFGIRAAARHGLNCVTAHLRAFPVKTDAFGHHPSLFFHQTFVKAVVAGFKTFSAGFDAFLISRFHETHSFFLVFPSLYPALKSEKHKKKTAVHPVQQFIGYSARP